MVSLEKEKLSQKFKNHAWFIAYAPFDDPKIAVAVLIEHGGFGGGAAAPLAKRIIAAYFPDAGVAE